MTRADIAVDVEQRYAGVGERASVSECYGDIVERM